VGAPLAPAERLMRSPLQTGLLFAVLVLAGASAWALKLAANLEVDARALAGLAPTVGSWSSEEIPVEDDVARMLRADFNLQRAYRHPLGERVFLYVGYYGTARGGRPEHTPWLCYPSTGWEIRESRVVPVDPGAGLRANELLVESEGDRRLVLFWYRSGTRTGITSGLGLSLAHLRGRLFEGRGDTALVRVSAELHDGDETRARSVLMGFASEIDRQLASHWPRELRRR
jgi:EpsI family protein